MKSPWFPSAKANKDNHGDIIFPKFILFEYEKRI